MGSRVAREFGSKQGVGNLKRAVNSPEFEFEGLTGLIVGQSGIAFARGAEQFPHPKGRQFAPFETAQTGEARTFHPEFKMGGGIRFERTPQVVGLAQFEFEMVLGSDFREAFDVGFPSLGPLNSAAPPPMGSEFEHPTLTVVENPPSPAVGGAHIKRSPNFDAGTVAIQPQSEQGRSLMDHLNARSNRGVDPKGVEQFAILHGVCQRRFHETKVFRPSMRHKAMRMNAAARG